MQKLLFSNIEDALDDTHVIATYYIELDKNMSIMEVANKMAIGQTLGTWVAVPGITEEMTKRHVGKVVNIYNVPAYELSNQVDSAENYQKYLFQIAFPTVNFSKSLAMLLTTVMGNDASTSAQIKLVDLNFSGSYFNNIAGPNYGIAGVRKLLNIHERALILSMIKPCLGFSASYGAKLFYKAAVSGGIDIIKDDELLGNPSFCPVQDRVKEYLKAADAAYEVTGKRVLYIPNITDTYHNMLHNAERAIESGAKALMINFATAGYEMVKEISIRFNVPILGHYAGSGMFYEGLKNGMRSPLAVGKLPRISGADMVMINTPYGGYPLLDYQYFLTVKELTAKLYTIKPTFPIVGGGVHPGMVGKLISELGNNIVIAAGGAIFGHPDGVELGGKAMMQAVEAVTNHISIEEYAKEHEALNVAINKWGIL
ncbi:RuBisCO large subunit C-terminal-like domain-containing protein [Oceanobacillus sp. Castelsardo]|uniref:RuBisCO large subunit C-terminal-like domain-containing protein n=1 Tax=Oceanobacillus sp. Castelsardo TaxID=1851204 RepID=UPI000839720C|nr:RuBisCO large subunit C-terminal-like domain-containing protein [Oceanobacillus sp. Castelsardo]